MQLPLISANRIYGTVIAGKDGCKVCISAQRAAISFMYAKGQFLTSDGQELYISHKGARERVIEVFLSAPEKVRVIEVATAGPIAEHLIAFTSELMAA
jgi:hypothetical protein